MSGPASWKSTSDRTAALDLLPCLLLVLAAYLGVVERSGLDGGHRAAALTGPARRGRSRAEGKAPTAGDRAPAHHTNVGIAAGRLCR